ncbi:hypothetical protein OKHIL_37990 [Mycolicibacterium mageritense]
MHATTSGAIDQNMSRPSCSNRDFAGLGAGVGWVLMVASIPAPKPGPRSGRITSHEPHTW